MSLRATLFFVRRAEQHAGTPSPSWRVEGAPGPSLLGTGDRRRSAACRTAGATVHLRWTYV